MLDMCRQSVCSQFLARDNMAYFILLYLDALSALTAFSARENVSNPNCSMYAFPAISSVTASFSAFSVLN